MLGLLCNINSLWHWRVFFWWHKGPCTIHTVGRPIVCLCPLSRASLTRDLQSTTMKNKRAPFSPHNGIKAEKKSQRQITLQSPARRLPLPSTEADFSSLTPNTAQLQAFSYFYYEEKGLKSGRSGGAGKPFYTFFPSQFQRIDFNDYLSSWKMSSFQYSKYPQKVKGTWDMGDLGWGQEYLIASISLCHCTTRLKLVSNFVKSIF